MIFRERPVSLFFFPGKLICLSYSPIAAVQGSLSTAKQLSFIGHSLKIGCRVVQFIHFADGWDNSRLN